MAMLLRDLISIPDRVLQGDYVLKLAENVGDDAALSAYVVTDQLAEAFDSALGLIETAVRTPKSVAAYLDGSFGSGKSHFLAVLHAILRGDPAAWSKDKLVGVVSKHAEWLRERRFLLVPFHLLDTSSLEAAILGGYVRYVRELRPDAPLPAVYRDDLLIANARGLRARLGDAAFIAALSATTGSDAEWASVVAPNEQDGDWDAESLDAALDAPHGDKLRHSLVTKLLSTVLSGYASAVSGDAGAFIPLEEGLAEISRHAKEELGYDAIVLLLDELVLWLAQRIGDTAFITTEAQKVVKLVESGVTHRPAPIISFVPRQRDLRELVGRDIAGAEATSLFDVIKHHDGRFAKIKLADENLPEIIQARLLQPKDAAAKAALDEAFANLAGARGRTPVWDTMLDAQGGPASADDFRATYPFSPAFTHVMVDVSGALQRARTALKLMAELLIAYRDELTVGQLVPIGAIYDVLVSGDDRPFSEKLRDEFEQTRRFYTDELRPALLVKHGLTEADAAKLPARHAFRADDLVVKTLLLAALVPGVPAFGTLSASRLAALNHGSVLTMIPGGERIQVANTLHWLSTQFGTFAISGDQGDPIVTVSLIGVDTKAIIRQARNRLKIGDIRLLAQRLLYAELGIKDSGRLVTTKKIVWRGTERVIEVVFNNVRDADALPDSQFEPSEPGALRAVIDYPFDDPGFFAGDDFTRVGELRSRGLRANTLVWLPAFLTQERYQQLEDLAAINDALAGENLEDLTPTLTADDRAKARAQLANQQTALRAQMVVLFRVAYGLSKAEDGQILEGNAAKVETFQDGLSLRPAVGFGHGEALDGLARDLLTHLYPKHPDLGGNRELTAADLATVLETAQQASLAPRGRVEPGRRAIEVMKRIATPLGLGETHEAAFVLSQDWMLALDRAAANTSGDLSVPDLRAWVDAERPGMPTLVQNLVIAAYALMSNRSWIQGENTLPTAPRLSEIRADLALRAQRLPTEQEYELACLRARQIFAVNTPSVCRAGTVQTVAVALRRAAVSHLEPARDLLAELERHADTLGLKAADGTGDAPRLGLARDMVRLLGLLAGERDDTELLTLLANVALVSEAPVYRAAVVSLSSLATAMRGALWDLLDALPAQAADADRAARAGEILAELRKAAWHDEQAAPLAPALAAAQQAAIALLTAPGPKPPAAPPVPPTLTPTPTAPPAATVPPARLPGLPSDAAANAAGPSADGTSATPARSGRGVRRARAAELDHVLADLRRDIAARPGVEFEISWAPVEREPS